MMNKLFVFILILLQSTALWGALQQPVIHHFGENTHAHFSGESHHHYYANRHLMTRGSGIIGSIVYAIEFGILEFISDTVVTSLRAGIRRLVPQLYTDKDTVKTKKLLRKKTDLENRLTQLHIHEKEQKLLEQTSTLIAQNQKQLTLLQSQSLTKEQQEQCARLANQNIELLEMHTRQVRNFLQGRNK